MMVVRLLSEVFRLVTLPPLSVPFAQRLATRDISRQHSHALHLSRPTNWHRADIYLLYKSLIRFFPLTISRLVFADQFSQLCHSVQWYTAHTHTVDCKLYFAVSNKSFRLVFIFLRLDSAAWSIYWVEKDIQNSIDSRRTEDYLWISLPIWTHSMTWRWCKRIVMSHICACSCDSKGNQFTYFSWAIRASEILPLKSVLVRVLSPCWNSAYWKSSPVCLSSDSSRNYAITGDTNKHVRTHRYEEEYAFSFKEKRKISWRARSVVVVRRRLHSVLAFLLLLFVYLAILWQDNERCYILLPQRNEYSSSSTQEVSVQYKGIPFALFGRPVGRSLYSTSDVVPLSCTDSIKVFTVARLSLPHSSHKMCRLFLYTILTASFMKRRWSVAARMEYEDFLHFVAIELEERIRKTMRRRWQRTKHDENITFCSKLLSILFCIVDFSLLPLSLALSTSH